MDDVDDTDMEMTCHFLLSCYHNFFDPSQTVDWGNDNIRQTQFPGSIYDLSKNRAVMPGYDIKMSVFSIASIKSIRYSGTTQFGLISQ